MILVQEILTDDGKFQLRDRPPAEAHIQLPIGRDLLIVDVAHIAKRGVQFPMARKIQRRTQGKLMLRIIRFVAAAGRVGAARFRTEFDSQFRVACSEPPPISDSIVRRQFRAVGFAFQPVG